MRRTGALLLLIGHAVGLTQPSPDLTKVSVAFVIVGALLLLVDGVDHWRNGGGPVRAIGAGLVLLGWLAIPMGLAGAAGLMILGGLATLVVDWIRGQRRSADQ